MLTVLVVPALIGVLVLCLEIGRFAGRRTAAEPRAGYGAIEGSVFALLGLLLAFSFSGAASRFDARRTLIVQEANDIGTAYLRLDLLPAGPRDKLRQAFGQYVDARLATYRLVSRRESVVEQTAKVAALQDEIWAQALAACRMAEMSPTPQLVLPALNQMFDISATRMAALHAHLPVMVVALLLMLELICALLAGYGMSGPQSWLHVISFAAILGITTYIIVDYEFPRFGLIRVEQFDQALVEVRRRMP